MHTDSWEFCAVHAHHAELVDFSSPSKVEEGQADDADLLVGARGTATGPASRVLARANLSTSSWSFELYHHD